MASKFMTTFSNAFSWMKIYTFWFKTLLKFVSKVSVNYIPALVQILAWRRLGDKPVSEPMIISLLTHLCVLINVVLYPSVINVMRIPLQKFFQLLDFIACAFADLKNINLPIEAAWKQYESKCYRYVFTDTFLSMIFWYIAPLLSLPAVRWVLI